MPPSGQKVGRDRSLPNPKVVAVGPIIKVVTGVVNAL